MFMTRFQRTTRVRVAAIVVAAAALVMPAVSPVHAAGLRDCADVTGREAAHVACYEPVWVDGVQLRMTFFAGQTAFPGATASDQLARFYLLAPQTDTAQETWPFPHDHVVPNVPRENSGNYSVLLHGFFVFCSAQGIASDLCAPGVSSTPFGASLARTVHGHPLTSDEAIESAAASGLITLLDSGGTVVGTIGPGQ
jgi:hypothetical protein